MEIKISNLTDTNKYCKKDGVPGVYVWGYYEYCGCFVPLYAGKSRNVFERLIQHYCRFKSGEYRCLSRQDLQQIYCGSKKLIPRVLYEPTCFNNVLNFQNNIFAEDHAFVLNQFTFRYIIENDKEIRKQAEIFLADTIGRDRLIATVNEGPTGLLTTELKECLIELTGVSR